MKNILFVDDEQSVLQGLRRLLYSQRDQWNMYFTTTGEEALSILSQSHFDVIVTDMRMPHMDGAALLSEVSRLHPHVIRIILSGQADEEAILRSAGKAHVFLTKPCDADVLKHALSRACSLTDLLSQESLKDVTAKMKSLPSMPQTYAELVQELHSEDPSIQKVAAIVSKDISMMARILHMANSAYFIGRQHFTNPTDAILRLGLRSIEGLVLYAHIFSQFDKVLAANFSIDDIMNHSVAVSSLCKKLARLEELPAKAADDAFTGGLMHDVGKLMLCANLPHESAKAIELARSEEIADWEAEDEIFGTNHAVIGAYLMRLWGLSDNVTETIAFHHTPSNSALRQVGSLMIVHAANALDRERRMQDQEGFQSEIDLDYLTALGMSERIDSWRDISNELD